MRTTVTLDSDTALLLREFMARRQVGFKQALNDAVRAGLSHDTAAEKLATPTFSMGLRPGISLDKAMQMAGELEDAEILRRMSLRK